ncbi:MAG: LysE family translocator [Gammaproteobacteria bacterium]|nr:LysE family translocator [Gammaproteobacteria bacterium]
MDPFIIAPDVLIAFTAVALLLCLSPGPDNLFVLAQSALYGRAAGLHITLGLCTGLMVHTAAVALGVAALIRSYPPAFNALKYAGAAYLLYLAWQAFRAVPMSLSGDRARQPNAWQLYRRGIIMNVSNPKVSLFFLALLPQFADPQRGPLWLQFVLLGVVFMLSTLLVFGLLALLAGSIGAWLGRSAVAQRVLHVLAGVIFIGLALRLLVTQI